MSKAKVNFSPEQITALFLDAAREGALDLLTQFLDAGMTPDASDSRGYTALIVASYNGHLDAARLLLDHGANIDATDLKGATALSGVAFKGLENLAELLIARGATIDHANYAGRTPLMFAIMFNRVDMARRLLEAGANPDLKDAEGVSARDLAERQNIPDLFYAHIEGRPRMSRFWNPRVHTLHPYIPGEQPRLRNLLKLNTNESPYGPSPKAIAAIAASANDDLRLYPDPTAQTLREAIAGQFSTTPERVFVGNGSDEVLAHAFRGLFHDDAPVLFSDVTYGFYPVYCGLFAQPHRHIPLDDDFRIDIDAYTGPCGGIVIANPNANTGIALPLDQIETLLQRHPDRTVIVDEAYVDFGAESAAPLTARYDNLLVVQTLSKSYALAGLRVGFAIGSPELVEGLNRVKDSFNSYPLSRPAQAGAIAAIRDTAWLGEITARVIRSRETLVPALENLGFQVLPSCANFVLVYHPMHPAGSVASALRDRSILVRHLSTPRIQNWLRITIGTDEACARLIEALKEILSL